MRHFVSRRVVLNVQDRSVFVFGIKQLKTIQPFQTSVNIRPLTHRHFFSNIAMKNLRSRGRIAVPSFL